MKQTVVNLVDQYRNKETRIDSLNRMVRDKNLEDYHISAWTGYEEVETEDFSVGDARKRVMAFLKTEIKLEKKALLKLGQKIAVEFGP